MRPVTLLSLRKASSVAALGFGGHHQRRYMTSSNNNGPSNMMGAAAEGANGDMDGTTTADADEIDYDSFPSDDQLPKFDAAIDPYALARDDPEAMARIKAEFDKLLIGPMPTVHAAHRYPRKVEGEWILPKNATSAGGAAAGSTAASSSSSGNQPSALTTRPEPYMPPKNLPKPDEVQGPLKRFEPKTVEEEQREMAAKMAEDERLQKEGRLYKVHQQCVQLAERQRAKRAVMEAAVERGETNETVDTSATATTSASQEDDAMDDIDMLMGASADEYVVAASSAAAAAAASSSSINTTDVDLDADPFAAFWDTFASKKGAAKGDGKAPEWFVTLCKDLFLRTTSSGANTTAAAAEIPPGVTDTTSAALTTTSTPASIEEDIDTLAYDSDVADPSKLADEMFDAPDSVDPYLWLPFNLRSEEDYDVGRYTFPTETNYDTATRLKLSNGSLATEYVCFCETYPFPDRKQLPTSMGTVPSKLYVKPDDPVPIVYLQLGEHMPPAMWLPIKPTATAVRRVLAEFAVVSAQHRDAHHEGFEERINRAEIILRNNNMPTDAGSLLRYAAFEAKDVNFIFSPTREYPNYQEFFLGEYDDPRELISYIQSSPFLFAIPHMQQAVDVHEDGMAPRIDGPGVGMGVYRTLYSKSIVMLKVHLSTEVKLPPQDPESFELLWRDVEGQVIPKSRIPVFARIIWPDHQKMAAGGKPLERFNKHFGTEFSPTMPLDAAMSVYYVMQWAEQMNNFMGIRGMRKRLDALLEAAQQPQPALLYPSTHDVPNPQYTNDELIGMHIQYLAHLGDPETERCIKALVTSGSAPIRMGCAKAALEIGDRELFRAIVSSEPAGRMQHYMTKLVITRKKRDLTAKVPKLMEDQYEFGGTLWARGGKYRIDPSTLEGSLDLTRLQNTHRVGGGGGY